MSDSTMRQEAAENDSFWWWHACFWLATIFSQWFVTALSCCRVAPQGAVYAVKSEWHLRYAKVLP